MSVPFVHPEEAMRGKRDYAQAGIAKGRTSLAIAYNEGVALIAQNSSASLYKTSEIHDNIGFIAVGKYDEFEALRVAGITMATQRAWQYSRADVSAVTIVRAFASTMSHTFTNSLKPLEIELIVAEIYPGRGTNGNGLDGLAYGSQVGMTAAQGGQAAGSTQAHETAQPQGGQGVGMAQPPGVGMVRPPALYRIRYDGAIVESSTHLVIGGKADEVAKRVTSQADQPLAQAVQHAMQALGSHVHADDIEVATLAPRPEPHRVRSFTRLTREQVRTLVGEVGDAANGLTPGQSGGQSRAASGGQSRGSSGQPSGDSAGSSA